MPNTLPRMKLSRDEEAFLRHWMYDEAHYRDGPGRAKALQVRHGVTPADLAVIIAAAIPDPADQQTIGAGPTPAGDPAWPWDDRSFRNRLTEAQAVLGHRFTAPAVADARVGG